MKNILITSNCFVKGQPVEKGVILENVDNLLAAELLTSGRAQIHHRDKHEAVVVKEKGESTPAPKKKAAKKSAKKKAK
jgi:hypothetical protein